MDELPFSDVCSGLDNLSLKDAVRVALHDGFGYLSHKGKMYRISMAYERIDNRV